VKIAIITCLPKGLAGEDFLELLSTESPVSDFIWRGQQQQPGPR
jgi:hypothetical protein